MWLSYQNPKYRVISCVSKKSISLRGDGDSESGEEEEEHDGGEDGSEDEDLGEEGGQGGDMKAAEAASQVAPSSPWGAPTAPQHNPLQGIGLGGMAQQQQQVSFWLDQNTLSLL